MGKAGRRPKNNSSEAIKQLGEPISRDMLKRALNEHMFNKNPQKWQIPSDEALDKLSLELSIMRGHFINSRDIWQRHDSAIKDATASLDALTDALKRMFEVFQRASADLRLARPESNARALAGNKEPRIMRMMSDIAVMRADSMFVPIEEGLFQAFNVPFIRNWEDCIFPLVKSCETALAPNDLSLKTRNGPFPRFLSALIRSVTGQDVKPSTIVAYVSEQRTKDAGRPRR